MPYCDVTVMIGKRAKVVKIEVAKNADIGQFETMGDYIGALAMQQEGNADKVAYIGGLYATEKEIKAELAALKKTEPKADAEFVAASDE